MTDDHQRRHTGPLALVAVALLVVSGCAGSAPEREGAGPSSSTTVTAGPTESFAPSTGSTSPTTTGDDATTDLGGACPEDGPVPPAGASDVTEVAADVDGDGRDDRVASYRRADGTGRLGVELAAGGTAAVDASDAGGLEGPTPPRALGGADLGGDGETVLAVTSAGASVVVVGLFQFVECSLARVTAPSGQTFALPVGGGVTHADGISCAGGELVARSAMSSDGETFATEDTHYRVDGNTLVEIRSTRGTLARPGDAAALDRYSTLDCPTLERGLGG